MSDNSAKAVADQSVADRLRSKGLRKLTLPEGGETITVRSLTILDLMEMGILPAGFLAEDISDSKKVSEKVKKAILEKIDKDPAFTAELITMIVTRCVVEPRVVAGDYDQVPEGAVHITAFGSDLLWLSNQLQVKSGMTQEVGPRARGFSEGSGSPGGGQDGEEVRDDSPGAPADDAL